MAATQKEFELGLVLAGATSAGAYTAGVADYLLEALESWERARAGGEVPDHRVRIRALSGASAGAITASLFVRALATTVAPVRDALAPPDSPAEDPEDQREPFRNPFYATWVQSIGIGHLLACRDLESRDAPLRSLLDSSVLPRVASNAFNVTDGIRRNPPPYVSDVVDVLITATNLRGVPYGFGLQGEAGSYRHAMTAHADHVRFSLSWPRPMLTAGGGIDPAGFPLDPLRIAPVEGWARLIDAALASGAFPVGLAPRLLSRRATDYDARLWSIPEDPSASGRASKFGTILPDWPKGIRSATGTGADPAYLYKFWCVDGGVMDNEPLELVRRALAGSERNPRAGGKATRAVIMIDPFPNVADIGPDYEEDIGLGGAIAKLLGAMIQQARFKPDELALAQDKDVYSRFVVSPVYVDASGGRQVPALASAVLGGFGGFLAESFRRHDFVLGRRNCQRFLQRHLVLPIGNPLFASWRDKPAIRQRYSFATPDGTYAPVIPLVPDARGEVQAIPLPRRPRAVDVDMAAVRAALRKRMNAAVPRLLDSIPSTGLRLLLRANWLFAGLLGQRRKAVDVIVNRIERELEVLE